MWQPSISLQGKLAARTTIFGYIMGFYNRTRPHSALGYKASVTFAA